MNVFHVLGDDQNSPLLLLPLLLPLLLLVLVLLLLPVAMSAGALEGTVWKRSREEEGDV